MMMMVVVKEVFLLYASQANCLNVFHETIVPATNHFIASDPGDGSAVLPQVETFGDLAFFRKTALKQTVLWKSRSSPNPGRCRVSS